MGSRSSKQVRKPKTTPLLKQADKQVLRYVPRMRTSSVLLYTLRGLSAEIAKNIVLAGVGTVTLLDDKDVVEDDLGANFFLREEDVGLKVRLAKSIRARRDCCFSRS